MNRGRYVLIVSDDEWEMAYSLHKVLGGGSQWWLSSKNLCGRSASCCAQRQDIGGQYSSSAQSWPVLKLSLFMPIWKYMIEKSNFSSIYGCRRSELLPSFISEIALRHFLTSCRLTGMSRFSSKTLCWESLCSLWIPGLKGEFQASS